MEAIKLDEINTKEALSVLEYELITSPRRWGRKQPDHTEAGTCMCMKCKFKRFLSDTEELKNLCVFTLSCGHAKELFDALRCNSSALSQVSYICIQATSSDGYPLVVDEVFDSFVRSTNYPLLRYVEFDITYGDRRHVSSLALYPWQENDNEFSIEVARVSWGADAPVPDDVLHDTTVARRREMRVLIDQYANARVH